MLTFVSNHLTFRRISHGWTTLRKNAGLPTQPKSISEMDDLDEEVPELIPVDDYEAIAGSATPDARDRVFEPPKRLEKTVPVTLITGFLGAR